MMSTERIDFILSPNSLHETPVKITDILNPTPNKEKNSSIQEFKMDYYTTLANCLGVPALSVPINEDKDGKYLGFPASIRL